MYVFCDSREPNAMETEGGAVFDFVASFCESSVLRNEPQYPLRRGMLHTPVFVRYRYSELMCTVKMIIFSDLPSDSPLSPGPLPVVPPARRRRNSSSSSLLPRAARAGVLSLLVYLFLRGVSVPHRFLLRGAAQSIHERECSRPRSALRFHSDAAASAAHAPYTRLCTAEAAEA